ncbi:DUF86 domain-containing protein [Candidatus Pacearchaeota archaeon CG10_big_fil_rev_8_21_14_0_10_30_48]|nr:MAG: DUF86 domain-containing protein [Candidatus Pacearchaeota archaeon CG10_big_fil_rev_8_21_14_0_10_30_48]
MDKKRILSKFVEIDSYLEELDEIKPLEFEDYEGSILNKRSIERILQISIEVVLDICNLLVSDLNLGIPADEDSVFDKLRKKKIISKKLYDILIEMKGFRNVLVYKYGAIEDEKVFEVLTDKLDDFQIFKEEILKFIEK